MTTDSDKTLQLKRALQAIKELRARLEQMEQNNRVPVAVIGMACRFPGGAESPEAYWDVFINKVDGITPVPGSRWDMDELFDPDEDAPGKVSTRWGGFLSNLDTFDAAFFGITPREASRMDPQQRLMLEVAWEAFEDAGQPLSRLAGSRTGVFVGIHSHSNGYFMMQATDPEDIDIYTGTGTSHSVVSGRISYLYDLQGPNLALDTACSSSLVAVHLASQSLRNGECDLALAGGVNVMVSPHFSMITSRMRMLAPDGRCKAFDSRADGIGRSEGCGAVVLKRLPDALRDGDPILAVIRGSAINQDGSSNGLTAPNGLSQQAVIRQALENAGVKPEEITYVETHGTGTALGDPIEVEALGAVYGQPRPDGLPLVLGSSKTNVGHMEGAAGIGGLIKAVLALQHRTIPANLHFQKLNPHISLDGTRLQIATDESAWAAGEGRRMAAVSAFGWSGTNAHIVLEEAPAAQPADAAEGAAVEFTHLLVTSAQSGGALNALAQEYARRLRGGDVSLAGLCRTAALRREHLPQRLAVAGRTSTELAERLEAFANDETRPGIATGTRFEGRLPGLVFVFSGQGGHWLGMGRQLMQTEAVFRQAMERCEQAFRPYQDWSLQDQINADDSSSRLDDAYVVQPVLFAFQVALAELWRSWGIVPDAVVGHSVGEAAAAYFAGALSLEDAARIIAHRSQLMHRTSGKGSMAAVGLSITEAQALIAPVSDRLSVAVSNSPASSVLSGDPETLESVLADLRARNIFCRPVKISVAAHSPQMQALRPELVTALRGIQPRAANIPIFSTVMAAPVPGENLDADYWGRNLCQPVRFAETTTRLLEDGNAIFVEVNPHPILLNAIEQTAQAHDPDRRLALVASMRRGEDETLGMRAGLGNLFAVGCTPNWDAVLAPYTGQPVRLPRYPWQRERYWLDVKPTADTLSNWFYYVDWKAQAQDAAPAGDPGHWMVFCEPGEGSAGEAIAAHLEGLGGTVTRVWPGDSFGMTTARGFTLDPREPGHFDLLFDRVRSLGSEPRGVAFCWSLSAPESELLTTPALEQAQQGFLGGALNLVQGLLKAAMKPRIWFITRQAQPAGGTRATGVAQATLWGFGRVLAFENPEIWGGLVDIDEHSAEQAAKEILGPVDQQVALRNGRRFFAQLARQITPPAADDGPAFDPNASYLITGGLGGLGLKVAAWMAARGAKHLSLMGRSAGSDVSRVAARELENTTGAQVVLVRGDASRAEDVERILAEIAASAPPLRGVVHAAGVVEDGVLAGQNWSAYEKVLAAKVSGAWNLHQFTKDLPLDHFVLFSSASSLLGTPGQSNYAAANAFLDALAFERQSSGLPARVINWGAWGEVGMAAQSDRPAALSNIGLSSFSPEKGLVGFQRALRQDRPQVAVMSMNWAQYLDHRPRGVENTFFAAFASPQTAQAAQQVKPGGLPDQLEQLEAAEPKDRQALLAGQVAAIVARITHRDNPETINRDQGFFQMGVDSLIAVELKNTLQKTYGRSLRTTLVFDFPSVNLLSRYLYSELYPQQQAQAHAEPEAAESLDDLSRDDLKNMLDDELRMLEEDM